MTLVKLKPTSVMVLAILIVALFIAMAFMQAGYYEIDDGGVHSIFTLAGAIVILIEKFQGGVPRASMGNVFVMLVAGALILTSVMTLLVWEIPAILSSSLTFAYIMGAVGLIVGALTD